MWRALHSVAMASRSEAEGKGKRNNLTLALKYEVVKTAEREKKLGMRKLSEMFNCGKTQISVILKNRERIKSFMKLMLLDNDVKLARDFENLSFFSSMTCYTAGTS